MFSYVSMLVEENIFDSVDIHFLIVGHTHASIDQYFSVLSQSIFGSNFIGSPLALENLLADSKSSRSPSGFSWGTDSKVKKQKNEKPLKIRKISVVYNLKSALKPLINKSIMYYPIPHHFRFEKYYGVATMQYAVYSTQKELLPKRPENMAGNLSY